jgi:ubiquinone/menaquinone biosynthesis C-methylase UbiE
MKLARRRLFLALFLPLLASPFASSCQSLEKPRTPLTPPPEDESIKPGINQEFLAKKVDLAHWVQTFEGEAREIAVQKKAIVASLNLAKGDDVADVGSGTGLFLAPLADAVGVGGRVYALDISPEFVDALKKRAKAEGLEPVEVRLSKERSVELPQFSIDAAFVCDTYHHFEYPRSTLDSIRAALKPDGLLAVVDFERTPESRAWVLEHVRAGSGQVIAEIEAAGFQLVDRPTVSGLKENYLLRFRKRQP